MMKMLNDLPLIMVRCLLLTVMAEVALGFVLGVRKKRDIVNVVLVNVLTNPFASSVPFVINFFRGLRARNIAVACLEVFALVTEALIYKKVLDFKRIQPFLLSLLLNAFSFLLGEVINRILY